MEPDRFGPGGGAVVADLMAPAGFQPKERNEYEFAVKKHPYRSQQRRNEHIQGDAGHDGVPPCLVKDGMIQGNGQDLVGAAGRQFRQLPLRRRPGALPGKRPDVHFIDDLPLDADARPAGVPPGKRRGIDDLRGPVGTIGVTARGGTGVLALSIAAETVPATGGGLGDESGVIPVWLRFQGNGCRSPWPGVQDAIDRCDAGRPDAKRGPPLGLDLGSSRGVPFGFTGHVRVEPRPQGKDVRLFLSLGGKNPAPDVLALVKELQNLLDLDQSVFVYEVVSVPEANNRRQITVQTYSLMQIMRLTIPPCPGGIVARLCLIALLLLPPAAANAAGQPSRVSNPLEDPMIRITSLPIKKNVDHVLAGISRDVSKEVGLSQDLITYYWQDFKAIDWNGRKTDNWPVFVDIYVAGFFKQEMIEKVMLPSPSAAQR